MLTTQGGNAKGCPESVQDGLVFLQNLRTGRACGAAAFPKWGLREGFPTRIPGNLAAGGWASGLFSTVDGTKPITDVTDSFGGSGSGGSDSTWDISRA